MGPLLVPSACVSTIIANATITKIAMAFANTAFATIDIASIIIAS